MILKKRTILGFTILILLAVTILSSCGEKDMDPEDALNRFSKLVEEEKLDDLRLKIYYINTSIFTRMPLSVDDLVNYTNVNKVVVQGNSLEEHIDLLKQLNKDVLKPVEKPIEENSFLDTRFYYVFETKKNRKIFDVAMWGGGYGEGYDYNIFVNGLEVQENDIFYDVIMPFLTDHGVEELNTYLGRWEVGIEDKS